jgi:hypothetical protein
VSTGHDSHLPTWEQLDRDGAIGETAEAADAAARDHSRSSFFKMGGLLAGAGLLLGGIPVGRAVAQGLPKRDVDILNFALTLEYLEAAFYREALDRGQLSGESLIFAQVTEAHEQAHVDQLKQVLGSDAVAEPRFDFQGTTRKDSFLKTAQTLEDTGVAAYAGQGPRIKTDAILAAAGSILAVEARHAAWVRDIRGGGEGVNPAPQAFEEAKDMQAILDAVEGTGFIKS